MDSRPKPPSKLTIEKLEGTEFVAGEPAGASKVVHKIIVPKGDWYDTGFYVRPWQYVNAITNDYPCELKIADTVTKSRLMKLGIFNAVIVTTDNLTGSSSKGIYKKEPIHQELAPVGDQGKIYIRVSDDAAPEKVEVTLQRQIVPEDDIRVIRSEGKENTETPSWLWRNKYIIILVVVGFIVVLVVFFVGFVMGRKFA